MKLKNASGLKCPQLCIGGLSCGETMLIMGKEQVTSQKSAPTPAITFHLRVWSGPRSLNSDLHVQVMIKSKLVKIGKWNICEYLN